MVLIGRYSQREFQIPALIFQSKSYYMAPRGYHIFQQQGMICNSCRPMRRQHDQRSFWSFLHWRRLVLVSHTIFFQQVFFLVLNLLPECIIPSYLLRLMDVLAIGFFTNLDTEKVNFYRQFLKFRVKYYYERNWKFPRQIEWGLMQMKLRL